MIDETNLKKTEKFFVDVILINYNKEPYIEEAVQSVINQTFKK